MTADWIPTDIGIEVSCGRDAEINIESKVGVSESQMTALKSFSEGALGLPNVLSLKTSLEKSSNYQVAWSEEEKVSIKLPVPAPPCGAQLICAYRIKRTFKIKTMKQRLFRDPVPVYLPELHDLTKIYKAQVVDDHNDPRCPCKKTDQDGAKLPIALTFGNLEILLEARDYGRGLYFNVGKQRYEVPDKQALVAGAAGILHHIPPLFRFLAGMAEDEEETKAQIRIAGRTVTVIVPEDVKAAEADAMSQTNFA
jgi:hypothetical protein